MMKSQYGALLGILCLLMVQACSPEPDPATAVLIFKGGDVANKPVKIYVAGAFFRPGVLQQDITIDVTVGESGGSSTVTVGEESDIVYPPPIAEVTTDGGGQVIITEDQVSAGNYVAVLDNDFNHAGAFQVSPDAKVYNIYPFSQ